MVERSYYRREYQNQHSKMEMNNCILNKERPNLNGNFSFLSTIEIHYLLHKSPHRILAENCQ